MAKSRVLHVRVEPDLLIRVNRAARKKNKKPSDWTRSALDSQVTLEEREARALLKQ